MSSVPQAPGAPAPAKKKGLHPLVWVGIGCGVLLLVAAAVVIVGGYFVVQKGKEFASDMEKNPALGAARLIVKLNPELEEVAVDEQAGTITVRNTKTGEVITVDLEDAKDGKFGFTSDGKTVRVETDQEGGTMHVTGDGGKEGTFDLSFGKGGDEKLPDWVPLYPGAEQSGVYTMTSDDGATGGVTLTTDDAIEKVTDAFREQLKQAGFEVQVNTFTTDEKGTAAMVMGEHQASKRTVHVILGAKDGKTTAAVTYSQGGEE